MLLGVVLDDVEGDRPPQPIGVSSPAGFLVRSPAEDRPPHTLGYELPSLEYLAEPPEPDEPEVTEDVLEDGSKLEKVIRDLA